MNCLLMLHISGRYECVAENGRERRTAIAIFSIRAEVFIEDSHESDSSPGDPFVLAAVEEAAASVDKALEATVARLFSGQGDASPSETLRLFRYPPKSERDVAREEINQEAGGIFFCHCLL